MKRNGKLCYGPLSQIVIARMAKEVACHSYGVSLAALNGRDKKPIDVVLARQCAMYLAHIVGQLTLAEVSQVFERDRSTIGHACNNVEDRRDSPIFDMQLDYMEKLLRERIEAAERQGLFAAHAPKERKSAALLSVV